MATGTWTWPWRDSDLRHRKASPLERVAILRGHGDGSFDAPATYPVGYAPQSLSVADFNGDGKPDIAVGNQDDGTVGVLLNQGDGTFAPQVADAVGAIVVSLAAADFNGDGRPDVAYTVADSDGDAGVGVLLSLCTTP